ncbi:MAG: 30S ribosomal protein S4 [Candidatus Diapherotrites archaeon]|uniref:Small ribosomal subunit protein uS4 n=1 Tax=Candidatus Iainarchaeum sp. TaxID=3101447 RepID=A0A497JHE4_9ARCH|nr:30S ribosomal protein S4 [Candidatus Diapherotrites archaeon]RLG70189.1 MAG: 30S ribosomal protein S4 [Candidatus Diapherotrites archaeon]
MGDPKKPKKTYERPRKPWVKQEIIMRKELCAKYGLKNKKELWKAEAILRNKRKTARELLALPLEERAERQKELIESLAKYGILKKDSTLDDVLSLTVEAILERRLQTIVWRKGMARTIKQARQLIRHGHIAISGKRVTAPSYLVEKREENAITYFKPHIEEKIMAVAKEKKGEEK